MGVLTPVFSFLIRFQGVFKLNQNLKFLIEKLEVFLLPAVSYFWIVICHPLYPSLKQKCVSTQAWGPGLADFVCMGIPQIVSFNLP